MHVAILGIYLFPALCESRPHKPKTDQNIEKKTRQQFSKAARVRASDHQGALSLFTGGWCGRVRSAGGVGGEMGARWGWDGES